MQESQTSLWFLWLSLTLILWKHATEVGVWKTPAHELKYTKHVVHDDSSWMLLCSGDGERRQAPWWTKCLIPQWNQNFSPKFTCHQVCKEKKKQEKANFQFRDTQKNKSQNWEVPDPMLKLFQTLKACIMHTRGLVSAILISFTLISRRKNEPFFFILGTSTTESLYRKYKKSSATRKT